MTEMLFIQPVGLTSLSGFHSFEGIVLPKMKVLSSLTLLHAIPDNPRAQTTSLWLRKSNP